MISQVKAGLFGMIAGLVASYLGLNVKGGAKSVGDAVNQTVVFAFMALFVVNLLVTAVGIKLTADEGSGDFMAVMSWRFPVRFGA